MKTKVTKTAVKIIKLFIIIISIYLPITHISGNEDKSEESFFSGEDSNEFMLGIIDNGVEDAGRYYLLTDSLLCNTWHRYGPWMRGPSWFQGDSLNADINVYKDSVEKIISDNRANNMKTIFMREKILYLCFGQRSDYQCEATGFDNDLVFYTYRTHSTGEDIYDNSSFGNNNRVRYCSVIPSYGHTAGYVCRDLRANREQINIHNNWGAYAVDAQYNWYVKPRIRIDTAYANNPVNYENNVCRVEVLNFLGDTIINRVIKVKYFKESPTVLYDGNYLEEYYWKNDPDLRIDTGKKFNPANRPLWDVTGKVDFRIYWYGQCNMWIDYVRVENQTAYDLFKHNYDNTWLLWEVNQIANQNSDNIEKFYIEEFEFSQIPCMKYVSDYIKSVNPEFSLMFDLNIASYSAHREDFWNFFDAGHIKRNLYDKIQPKEVFSYSYPLKGRYYNGNLNTIKGDYYIPNTLPKPNLVFNPLEGVLAEPVSPSIYDNWLENILESGESDGNMRIMRLLDSLTKQTNLPLIFMPQGHMVYWQYHQLKEPTNEELKLLTYLGLAYGAKGILHYSYNGSGCFTNIAVDSLRMGYDRGFYNPQDPPNCGLFGTPRFLNAYVQNKWTNVREINNHLKKWGNYLLVFDNNSRRTYSYRTERSALLSGTYFDEILTYKLSTGSIPCPETVFDSLEVRGNILQECKEDRYLQAGVFNIPTEIYNKYFMMINRRCSPFKDETSQNNNGGRRLIKVRFDAGSESLNGFNNWKLIDLYSDSVIAVFNKYSSIFIDLGWYMPGEGKLYKITPVN